MIPGQTIATGFVVAIVGFASSFAIVLQGLINMGATPAQAASGLMAAAIAMGLCGIALSLWKRLPISVAWSTPGAAMLAVVATPASFGEAIGAFLIAGLLTIAAGLYRPLGRLIALIPGPLAQAMLAGVLFPLCTVPFLALAELPAYAVPVLLTWLIAGEINRLYAVPAAVAVTLGLIAYNVDLSALTFAIAPPVWTTPTFSVTSLIGLALPLFVVTMATQNIPGVAILRSYDYTPTPGPLFAVTGAFSALTAPFGNHGTCLAAITAAMCANEDSHPDRTLRYWSAVLAGAFYCALGLFAGVAAALFALAPPMAIGIVAGLALVGVLANAAQAALTPPETRQAAAITLMTTASGVTILGIGGAFWGLVLGCAIYAVQQWRAS